MRRYNEAVPDKIQVFWGEIAPSQHLLRVYEHEMVFLDTLECFARCGLLAKESVVVIATSRHLQALQYRLYRLGFDPERLIESRMYMPVSAEETLDKFMVRDWPDETLFRSTISGIIGQVNSSEVRVFAEMVAVLWAKGLSGATVHLEHLWNNYIREEKLSLFCAYPKSGFTQDPHLSLQNICACQAMVASGKKKPAAEVYFHAV